MGYPFINSLKVKKLESAIGGQELESYPPSFPPYYRRGEVYSYKVSERG
jgi:hypothetical protein